MHHFAAVNVDRNHLPKKHHFHSVYTLNLQGKYLKEKHKKKPIDNLILSKIIFNHLQNLHKKTK